MTIDELKKQVEEMQYKVEQTRTDLSDAENNLDDLESYASSGRDNISDCKVSVNDLDDELEEMYANLNNLEGFDVDKVRKEVAEEMVFKLTNKFGKFIRKALASDLSTETDNQ